MKLCLPLILCLAAVASGQTRPTHTPPPLTIGVWMSPTSDLAKWQARGVNTAHYIPLGHDQAAWLAAAKGAGLRYVVQPDAPYDPADPLLTAVQTSDEPDIKGDTPASLAATYAALQAKGVPVLLNFDGSRVLGIQDRKREADYRAWLPSCDIAASDIYPVTAWGQASPDWLRKPADAASLLAKWSGKPQWVFVECANQRIGPAGTPTPAQMRYEAWHAILSGATGIVYFPEAFNPFTFDATPADIAAELPLLNKDLAAVAPFLSSAKPIGVAAGFECIAGQTRLGTFTLLLNSDTANVKNYFGFPIAPGGVLATLDDGVHKPAKILAQTPLPIVTVPLANTDSKLDAINGKLDLILSKLK